MWNIINISDKTYMVKHSKLNNNNEEVIHTIYISNLIYLWEESLSDVAIVDRCQTINPLIEADSDTLIEHVINLLITEKGNKELAVSEDYKTASLEIKSDLEGIIFNYNFSLTLGDPKILFEEFTLHMAIALQQLETNKNQLVELIKKKDIEINQYKIEGAQLARKLVETNPFNEKDLNKHVTDGVPLELANRAVSLNSLYDNSDGITTILLQNLGIDVEATKIEIKQELQSDKQSTSALPGRFITSGINSRKRRYFKPVAPGKFSYNNDSEDDASEVDNTEEIAPKVEPIVSKRKVRRLNL